MGGTSATHEELRNAFILLVGILEGKKPLDSLGRHVQVVLSRTWNAFVWHRTWMKGRVS
jgi:hypothetical protein